MKTKLHALLTFVGSHVQALLARQYSGKTLAIVAGVALVVGALAF